MKDPAVVYCTLIYMYISEHDSMFIGRLVSQLLCQLIYLLCHRTEKSERSERSETKRSNSGKRRGSKDREETSTVPSNQNASKPGTHARAVTSH